MSKTTNNPPISPQKLMNALQQTQENLANTQDALDQSELHRQRIAKENSELEEQMLKQQQRLHVRYTDAAGHQKTEALKIGKGWITLEIRKDCNLEVRTDLVDVVMDDSGKTIKVPKTKVRIPEDYNGTYELLDGDKVIQKFEFKNGKVLSATPEERLDFHSYIEFIDSKDRSLGTYNKPKFVEANVKFNKEPDQSNVLNNAAVASNATTGTGTAALNAASVNASGDKAADTIDSSTKKALITSKELADAVEGAQKALENAKNGQAPLPLSPLEKSNNKGIEV